MKKLLAILLVVATLFCIVACGNKDDGDSGRKDPTTTAQNTTTVPGSTETTTVVDPSGETTTVVDPSGETTTDPNPTTTVPTTITTSSEKDNDPLDGEPGIKGVRPADSNNWNKVVNGVFTSDLGGLQLKAEGWKTYTLYGLNFVPEAYNNQGQTNAVCIRVYDADPADVFAAKTQADFETTLQATIEEGSFQKITVCGYPAIKAVVTDAYYVWVVNTPTHKYFINFMQAPLNNGGYPFATDAAAMMATVKIYK